MQCSTVVAQSEKIWQHLIDDPISQMIKYTNDSTIVMSLTLSMSWTTTPECGNLGKNDVLPSHQPNQVQR